MKKIVINTCPGGFGLSASGQLEFIKLSGLNITGVDFLDDELFFYVDGEFFSDHFIKRDDPALVSIAESSEERFVKNYCALKVVEVPNDVAWYVEPLENGTEIIREIHRTWC